MKGKDPSAALKDEFETFPVHTLIIDINKSDIS